MKRLFAQSENNIASRLTALLLTAWLSGAVCLLSCGALEARAAWATNENQAAQTVAESSSCHSSGHGKVEKQPETSEKTVALISSGKHTPDVDCCAPLHFVQINQAQNVKQLDTAVFTASVAVEPLKPAFKRQKVSFQSTYQPISLNRGSTYLRNCVFRI